MQDTLITSVVALVTINIGQSIWLPARHIIQEFQEAMSRGNNSRRNISFVSFKFNTYTLVKYLKRAYNFSDKINMLSHQYYYNDFIIIRCNEQLHTNVHVLHKYMYMQITISKLSFM